MPTKSKQSAMTFLHNPTTSRLKVRDYSYLRSMNEKKETDRLEEEIPLTPYTKEELLEMAEKGRRQIAAGKNYTTKEVIQHCLSSKSHHKSV